MHVTEQKPNINKQLRDGKQPLPRRQPWYLFPFRKEKQPVLSQDPVTSGEDEAGTRGYVPFSLASPSPAAGTVCPALCALSLLGNR